MGPKAVVLDEPFSGLDYSGVRQVLRQLVALKDEGTPVIVISHQLEKLLAHTDRLVLFDHGTVTADGSPPEVAPFLERHDVRNPLARGIALEQLSWLRPERVPAMPRGAQPLLFHYIAKDTPLHAMDPRAKLALLLLVGIAVALAHKPWQFALVGTALACALAAARLPLRALLRQALPFALLVAAVFAAKLFLTPGSPLPLLGAAGAT